MAADKEVSAKKREDVTKKEFFIGKKEMIIGISIFCTVLLLSNGLLYYFLTADYNQKVTFLNKTINFLDVKVDEETARLSDDITLTGAQLTTRIDQEKANSDKKRKILENETLANFIKMENFVTQKTTSLQLNLESQLSEIETDVDYLELTSSELQNKIDTIRVESADFSEIIEDVVKAVVSIKTNTGQASGFFFNDKGYIMTNKHVIEGKTSIIAVDYNSIQYPIRILGVAVDADLAILKIDADKTFDYLDFETNVNVGQRVIAVGNPLGLSFTVTEGIISAINRDMDNTNVGFIQTDVSINAGNSGGPLVNSGKRVVGINTFKFTSGEGLGFAIPAVVAQDIAQQAVEQNG